MKEGMERLKSGNFNNMTQQGLEDGSVIVSLYSRKDDKSFRFRVKDLYGPNEEVVDIVTGEPIE